MTSNPPKLARDITGYRNLFNEKDWSKLHPDIQRRFSIELHKIITYRGEMSEVYLSLAGKLLAQLCRLIGTPLALHCEKNVPMLVNVYPNQELGGMTWDRFYHYKNSPLNRVKSTKCLNHNGIEAGLVEMVGFGFGMELKVYEKDHAIFFESEKFFWKFKNIAINVPNWFSPGKTVVSQKALDDHRFEFRLDVEHPILGKVFKQVGIFESY